MLPYTAKTQGKDADKNRLETRLLYMCRQAAKPLFCCAEKCAADVKRSINTTCEKGGLKRAVQTKLPACDKRRLKRAIQWINRNCDVRRKIRKNI